jgi:predicted DNA-binding transcriptional regulator YafY
MMMRADRLISLLMLLQSRGRMTAQDLAAELDVSERTIYRDIEALSCSGVPVYPEYGPGGGFALLESYRTNLTGMTDDELSALFMLSVPAPLEKLGVSQELRSALLKLSAALPSSRRASEEQVHNRFLIDWEAFAASEPVPHLRLLQQAVWQNRRVLLSYRLLMGIPVVDVPAEPYALVAKAGVWYLVAMREGGPRVFRVAELSGVQVTGEIFARRADFNLPAFWEDWCRETEQQRISYPVRLRFSPQVLPYLPLYFGQRAQQWANSTLPADADGWRTVTVEFESLERARGLLLGLGRAVEVLEPLALRLSLVDVAEQIVAFYKG